MSKKAAKKKPGRPRGRKYSGVFQVRIEPRLHASAMKKADREGITLAEVIRTKLKEWEEEK